MAMIMQQVCSCGARLKWNGKTYVEATYGKATAGAHTHWPDKERLIVR